MIQHIMLGLRQNLNDPKVQEHMGKLVHQLGPAQVWQVFLEAQRTSLLKQDGSKRSPGGTFFVLLQKRRQLSKLRQAAQWSSNPYDADWLLSAVQAVQYKLSITSSLSPFASPCTTSACMSVYYNVST